MWAAPQRSFDIVVAYYGALDLADPALRRFCSPVAPSAASSSSDAAAAAGAVAADQAAGVGGCEEVAAVSFGVELCCRSAAGSGPDVLLRSHGSKHQALSRLYALHPGLLLGGPWQADGGGADEDGGSGLGGYSAVAAWDDDLEAEPHEASALLADAAAQ
jgi:hypothetical protein